MPLRIPSRHRRLLWTLLAMLVHASAAGADATVTPSLKTEGLDHEQALQARERGEIRPIAEIIERLLNEVPGEVIEVELEREVELEHQNILIYEIKLIDPEGQRIEVEIDAATGTILEIEKD